jgi:intracellular sulfur oxidation DsrE/DsrF family protein
VDTKTENDMKTLKTNQTVCCTSIENARVQADKISNGVIIVKNNSFSIVNYKTYEQLKSSGYKQVR